MHIYWRWEFLSKALDHFIPLFDDLQLHFDEKLMLASESGVLSGAVVKETARVLSVPCFIECCELVRVAGKTIERTAHKLEGCPCHEHVWVQKTGHKRKARIMQHSFGHATCVWKGRRGPWFAAEGFESIINDVQHCTSEQLQHMISGLNDRQNAALLDLQQRFRASLTEVPGEKCSFWCHIPWKCLGFVHACCGGDLGVPKRIATECIAELDAAIASGKCAAVHRIAILCLSQAVCVDMS